MGVPFFLSVLLLLLCQHGFGFRFRSTAVLGYGRGYRYPSEGRYCAYSRGRHCRDAVPYQRNEFNCSADEGLPCEEVYALRAVISKLGLPTPSISRSYCSESDDNSISIQCDCDKTATNICHITSVVTFSMSLSGNIHERLCELTYLEQIFMVPFQSPWGT